MMLFPSAVIPLTAACILAAFGSGSCAAMMGQNRLFMQLCFVGYRYQRYGFDWS